LYGRLAPPYLAGVKAFVEAASKERAAIAGPLAAVRQVVEEIGGVNAAAGERALFSKPG
jgi:hypothetical protein